MQTRKEWIALLHKIVLPVLRPLAEGRLHETLKPDLLRQSQSRTAPLEAFGRTVLGFPPGWPPKALLRKKRRRARSLPNSPAARWRRLWTRTVRTG